MASILVNVARICDSQFKCNYLKNQKHLIKFLFHSWTLHQTSNISKKRMMVIANVFPKLQTVKNFVRLLRKKRRFRTSFDSQHVKVSKTLAKSPSEQFYHIFAWFWGKLIWKTSPLLMSEILVLFINILKADGKYPGQYCEKLWIPIQMQLSEKPKIFDQFFVPFLEPTSNFKHFQKKDDGHS